MKGRFFTIAFLLFFLGNVASAQIYTIRTDVNTNLRNGPGLDRDWIETVPTGTLLQVTGTYNRWLRIHRNGRDLWMASWLRHTRVQSSAQPSMAAGVAIDNCCFVNRTCTNQNEWQSGYWAFQNNECPAPGQSVAPVSQTPVSQVPSVIDNCCFVDRQCSTDAQWMDGYRAYQQGQCHAPPPAGSSSFQQTSHVDNCCFLNWMCQTDTHWWAGFQAKQRNQCDALSPSLSLTIEGSPDFTRRLQAALNLMRVRTPWWYAFALSGLNKVKQVSEGRGVDVSQRVYYSVYHDDNPPPPGYESTDAASRASTLVHEATHVHRYERGVEAGGLPGETEALQNQLHVLEILAPGSGHVKYSRELLANIHRPECQWWGPLWGVIPCEQEKYPTGKPGT